MRPSRERTCPKCGSKHVVMQYPQVTMSGSYLVFNEGVSPRKVTHFILASVCMDCGFVELYRADKGSLIPPPL
jgi:predicted nucleic-acid-binding Zn-ribbon protein